MSFNNEYNFDAFKLFLKISMMLIKLQTIQKEDIKLDKFVHDIKFWKMIGINRNIKLKIFSNPIHDLSWCNYKYRLKFINPNKPYFITLNNYNTNLFSDKNIPNFFI